MARGRMLDKRISNSKKLAACSDGSRNLWFMLMAHLDRDGRIAFDDLDDLKIEIIPYFKWSTIKISNYLNELADIGLIKLYPDKGKIAIYFERFKDFQYGLKYEREAESKIGPYKENPESSGEFRIGPEKSLLRKEGSLSLSLSLKKEGRKEYNTIAQRQKNPPAGVSFDSKSRKFQGISPEDIEAWKKAYPACLIETCLDQMAEWLLANPSKAKSNYRKFITNWLKREQDRGGSSKGRTPISFKEQERLKAEEERKRWLEREEARYQKQKAEAKP